MNEIPSGLLEEMLRTTSQGDASSHSQLPDVGHLIGNLTMHDADSKTTDSPYLEIIEQPKSRGFRFRYPCEGPSHGGLPGATSTKARRTYPSVKLHNYSGKARLIVSLVTTDHPPRRHAHSLVGKNCRTGTCLVELDQDMTASFPNLGILHETKRNVPKALHLRYAWDQYNSMQKSSGNEMQVDDNPDADVEQRNLPPLADGVLAELKKSAEEDAKNMNLSVVRLCFQAFLPDEQGQFTCPLPPCLSDPVYDSKAPSASTLKICRMDRHAGSVAGNDEIFLLCDRVQKDDIDVVFFDKDTGHGSWEAPASFSANDVHRQYAIVFRTPKYWNQNISRSTQVFIQLRRKTDGEVSEPKVFTYQPLEYDVEQIGRKRRKKIPNFQESFLSQLPQGANISLPPALGSLNLLTMAYNLQSQAQVPVSGAMNGSQAGGGAPSGEKTKRWPDQGEPMDLASSTPQTIRQRHADSQLMDVVTSSGGGGDHIDPSDRSFEGMPQHVLEEIAAVVTGAIRNYAASNDVKYLLAPHRLLAIAQDESGDTPLHMAVIHSRHRAFENFITVLEGLPVTALDVRNNLQQTPLHIAVLTNQPNVVEKLILSGASTDIADQRGNTAAHIACKKGEVKCLQALLRRPEPQSGRNKYADLTVTNNDGLAPLHLAAKSKNIDCLRLLHRCRADVNIQDAKSGRTALHFAVELNDLAIAGSLVTEFGADVDYPTFNGETPLHLAAGRNDKSFVSFLLAAGADPEPATALDKSPADLATSAEVKIIFDQVAAAKQDGRSISLQQMFQPGKTAMAMTTAPQTLMSGGNLTSGGHMASGQLALGSLKQLGYVERLRLGLILDPKRPDEKDWRGLAKRLGESQLITALSLQKSPTRALLQQYESRNGSIEGLLSALIDLGRADAATALQEAISLSSGSGGPVGLSLSAGSGIQT